MITKLHTNNFTHRHLADVEFIQNVCLLYGYQADLEDCATAWELYSESLAAGWIHVGEEPSDVWSVIQKYVESVAK